VFNETKNNEDILLAKYNSSGCLVWNRTWGGASPEEGYDIVLDNSDNIFIIGYLENQSNSNDRDIYLVKFTNTGEYLWNRTWGEDYWDIGYSLEIDAQKNLYIAGYTESIDTGEDVILLKYNSTGDLKWNKTWGGIDNDEGNDVILDALGNIYITGLTASYGPSGTNLVFMKYNSTGDLQWNKTWGGSLPDEGKKMVIQSLNEILVVGNTRSYGSGGYDMMVLKWNNTGSLVWGVVLGGAEDDYGYSIVQDAQNNSFICGLSESYGDLDGDIWIVKINQTGSELWNKTWGGEQYECAFDILLDNASNLFLVGQTKCFGDTTGDLLLVKLAPRPSQFNLLSDTGSFDTDGTFTLEWTRALDAKNYSLYHSNQSITTINENVTAILSGAKNNSFIINNLAEGEHFFKAIAFNDFGNSSSNCLKITVLYPPGAFNLNSSADDPDNDGCFKLNWSESRNADNFSIYSHTSYIKEIDNNGTIISEGILPSQLNYTIENKNTGDYYYVVVAKNLAGDNISNCIHIKVGRTPLSFDLSSDADNPDGDGEFYLIWTPSNFSSNYSIYYSRNPGVEGYSIYKQGLVPIKDWTEADNYTYLIYDLTDGTYYFKILAYNIYGDNSSNVKTITIQTNSEDEEDSSNNQEEKPEDDTFLYELLIIFIFIGLLSVLIVLFRQRTIRK